MSKQTTMLDVETVKQGITELRQLYATEKEIRDRLSRPPHRAKRLEKVARELNLNEEIARKLRQFADPKNGGYSRAELNALCRVCKENGFVIGTQYVIRLLSISKERGERARFQEEAIENHWTCARLETEIRARYGRRDRRAGRRPRIPNNLGDLLATIQRQSERWLRFGLALSEGTIMVLLPEKVTVHLGQIDSAMKDLQRAIAKELEKLRSRQDRQK
jgi:hypothetical protein